MVRVSVAHFIDAVTEFLQAEGTHDHPIRMARRACSNRDSSRFYFLTSTVALANDTQDSHQR